MPPSDAVALYSQAPDDLLQQIIDALADGRIDYARLDPTRNKPSYARGRFPFYPATGHAITELVFTDRPRTSFYVADAWATLPPDRALCVLPGVAHSEKCIRRNMAYNLLWVTVTPEAVGLHVTIYRRNTGYGLLGPRLAFHPSVQGQLWDALEELTERDDALARTAFQGLLAAALCQAARGLDHGDDPARSYQRQVAERVQMIVNDRFREDLTVAGLAELVHYSPGHLNKLFREHVGTPIKQYLVDTRLDHARQLLDTTNRPIKRIAYDTGFNDPLYFSRLFRSRNGCSPTQWRRSIETPCPDHNAPRP